MGHGNVAVGVPVAVMNASCAPALLASSMAVRVKSAGVWPASIVTVAGTAASVMSSLPTVTVSAAALGVLRVTVPVSVASLTRVGAIESVSAALPVAARLERYFVGGAGGVDGGGEGGGTTTRMVDHFSIPRPVL